MLIAKTKSQAKQKRAGLVRIVPWVACFILLCSLSVLAQDTKSNDSASPPAQQDDNAVLPGDWAPELLDGILSSPNTAAHDALFNAAFAAGPAVIPQLEAALKDDRTAEFAAQSLAYIGGNQSFEILSRLVSDPRDLDLRRFFYGALGEIHTAQATQILLDTIARSDAEPDRTVTEAAIIALTVRSEGSLLPALKQVQSKVSDVVIHDDLENAYEVIEARAKYLASPEGKNAGDSVEQAVRSYFSPALEPLPTSSEPVKPAVQHSKTGKPVAPSTTQTRPLVSVEVERMTFSPDKSRVLAHVIFQDPTAEANYDMVLQKQFGAWTIASVWLGTEKEKPPITPNPKTPSKNDN